MEKDFNSYSPYMNYGNSQPQPSYGDDFNSMYSDPVLNPIMQYEQAYTYYRFLCMQMDYKIKCKEYDKMCGGNTNNIGTNPNNMQNKPK